MQFLLEKRNEPYMWYGEVSIAKENCTWCQEALAGYGSAVSRSKLVQWLGGFVAVLASHSRLSLIVCLLWHWDDNWLLFLPGHAVHGSGERSDFIFQ